MDRVRRVGARPTGVGYGVPVVGITNPLFVDVGGDGFDPPGPQPVDPAAYDGLGRCDLP